MEIAKIGSLGTQPISSASIAANRIGLATTTPIQPKAMPKPEGIELRQRIAREYGIEVLDSDVRFVGAELQAVEETLKKIKKKKKKHLAGVKKIVKNRKMRLKLIEAMDTHAGGAYIAEDMTVLLFDNIKSDDIPEVLTHEIGHAVNYFNISFDEFMDFVKKNDWNMAEFQQTFFPGNQLYQLGLMKTDIPKNKWEQVWDYFSLDSLVKNQSVDGKILLTKKRGSSQPWDKNPLERFAWTYEWFVNKKEFFKKTALKAYKEGDPSWIQNFKYLKENVFNN